MPNHYHLLIETPTATLSDGMEWLNGRYAQRFNLRHGVEGHVLERRFRSTAVRSEGHLFVLSSYIVLNPVRAGLCAHPAEWRWSSYLAFLGRVPAPPFLSLGWLEALFGDGRGRVDDEYERWISGQLATAAPARASP